jgi:hypothetical protein
MNRGRTSMDENQASVVAGALGGETWNSGGEIRLVMFRIRAVSEGIEETL